MNIREGLRRAVIVGTVLAEIAMVMYILYNPSYHDRSGDMLAILVFGGAIPIVAFAIWIACNWVIRGFGNSN